MNPTRSQQLTTNVVDVYNAMEDEILLNVARFLASNNGVLTKESINTWQIQQLAKMGSLTQANVITIAKYSGRSIDEVSKSLEIAQYETVKRVDLPLQEAIRQGLLVAPAVPVVGQTLEGILGKYVAQARNTFNLINTTMLDGARQVYLDVVNSTVGKVVSGTRTPRQAIKESLRKWADKGLPALVDKARKKWSPEAYLTMVTRSTVNNVANESQFAHMDSLGSDLIEVSSHNGARPLCAPFQGRIYSRSGMSKKYPAWSTTSYGEKAGLLGVNCRHVTFPFVEGMSTQRYFPMDQEQNDKAYQESQQQRKLERAIRKAKRELYMMEELGDSQAIKEAKQKVTQKQAVMREFIKETGRRRRYEREAPAEQTLKTM
ncbi:phage minor capsid protein [Bacillus paranthracis]|uniref:phage minor capsid protein n=1 Tax=Bacillus paranthracis TaxID=2026186 RepID=UPI003D656752